MKRQQRRRGGGWGIGYQVPVGPLVLHHNGSISAFSLMEIAALQRGKDGRPASISPGDCVVDAAHTALMLPSGHLNRFGFVMKLRLHEQLFLHLVLGILRCKTGAL